MPFMVVSDEEYEREISRLRSDVLRSEKELPKVDLTIEKIEQGRGPVPNVPEGLREIIAEESLNGTPAKDLERIFGVSPASISAYKHGATSTASYNKPIDKLLNVRNRVSSRAANRLNEALKALSTKDLEKETAKDISSIAKDMATVFDKISPVRQVEREEERAMHIHLYAPKMKTVDDYEMIDITAKSTE